MLVKNVFSSTTGCDKLKKDDIKKHAEMQDHRAVLEAASVHETCNVHLLRSTASRDRVFVL